MKRKPTRISRPRALFVASALAAIAMLALAGPASAQHGRHHHRHHYRHMFDAQVGPAGTIASFDETTGKLTITLTGGETITGFVTEDTEIECGQQGNADQGDDDDQGDQGSQCTTEALVVGAAVKEAELTLSSGKATFEQIVLEEEGQESQKDQQDQEDD